MMNLYEQAIIEKVRKQRKINEQLRADPPYEQDNIPNMFSCLTNEEFDYFMSDRKRLIEIVNSSE